MAKTNTIQDQDSNVGRVEMALQYAGVGLAVLPYKYFVGALTPNGVLDATTDRSVIRKMWKEWPDARPGVALGEKSSNVIALVTDGEAGEETLRAWRGQKSSE